MEQLKVSDSMHKAEREIHSTETDIALEDKFKIVSLETSIKELMQDKDYAVVKAEYLKMNLNYNGRQSPESILETVKIQFDKADRSNQELGASQLKSIVDITKTKLSELKTELAEYDAREEDLIAATGKEIGRISGGDRVIAKPGGLDENMDQVESLLGLEPRLRIDAYTETNNKLLGTLKQPQNLSKYLIAKGTYSHLTGGLYLEEASVILNNDIKKTFAKIKDMNSFDVRKELLQMVEKQLAALRGIYTILASALTSQPAQVHAPEPQKENIPESQKITNDEMTQVLDVIFESVRWSEDKSIESKAPPTFWGKVAENIGTHYNVGKAYTYYTGRTSDQIGSFGHPILDNTLGNMEAGTVGLATGGINALTGLSKFSVQAVDAVTNLGASRVYGVESDLPSADEIRDALAEKAQSMYDFMSGIPSYANLESLRMLGRFISIGMKKTTQAERVMLVSQISSELFAGEALGGGVLKILSSKGLGSIALKFGNFATKIPGVSSVIKASKFIISKCPNLTIYGYDAANISKKLKEVGKTYSSLYDLLLDTQDTVGDVQGVYSSTAGQVPSGFGTLTADKLKYAPVVKDLITVKADILQALQYSEEIGLEDAAVRDLKEQIVKIDARLGSVKT